MVTPHCTIDGGVKIALGNVERLVFPADGIRKGDVIAALSG